MNNANERLIKKGKKEIDKFNNNNNDNNDNDNDIFQARVTAPNRRHLFLGQALLLGLFLLAGLSAAASLSQNPLSCAAFRLVGLPAALVFAALLVKCVFLLSLNSGVYLPAPYQVRLNIIVSLKRDIITRTFRTLTRYDYH